MLKLFIRIQKFAGYCSALISRLASIFVFKSHSTDCLFMDLRKEDRFMILFHYRDLCTIRETESFNEKRWKKSFIGKKINLM